MDDVAALFVRVPDRGALQEPEVDIDDPDLFPSLDGMGRVDLIMRSKARSSFYYAMHRYKRALETWEEGGSRFTRRTVRAGDRDLVTEMRRDPGVDTVWTTSHLLKDAEDLRAWVAV